MIMKPSKISFPSSGYRSPLLSYWAVVAIVAFLFVFIAIRNGIGNVRNDTMSYYSAGDVIFSGAVDELRTPVYPIILYVLKATFGFDGSRIAVSILQAVVFIISIVYVYKSAKLFLPRHTRLHFWITIFYVLLQFDRYRWIDSVLSDTLAIYCSAFLAYCIIRAAQPDASFRYAAWSSVWLLLLVFNRPVLMCYIPVIVIFWIALYLKHRKQVLKNCLAGLGGIVIVVALIGIYSHAVNARYGIHSVSFVGSANNYAMLRYGGIITPDDTDDPTFRSFMEKQIEAKADNLTLEEQFDEINQIFSFPRQLHPVVEQTVNNVIKSNQKSVAQTIVKRFMEINEKYPTFVHVLILLAGIVLLVYSYKYRRLPLIPWTLLLFTLSLMVAMYVGAMSEWKRLSAPMLPMFSLLVGWAFSRLSIVD